MNGQFHASDALSPGNRPKYALDMRQVGPHKWSESCGEYKKPCACRESNPKLPVHSACSLVSLITELSQPRACHWTSAQSVDRTCLWSCACSPHSWFSCLYFYFNLLLPIFHTDVRIKFTSCWEILLNTTVIDYLHIANCSNEEPLPVNLMRYTQHSRKKSFL